MIPLKDYNPVSSFPIVCITLIVINVAAFAADRLTGHFVPVFYQTAHGMAKTYQFIGGLSQNYALVPKNLTGSTVFSWPTIFTSMFLHGNWLHIASNMLYLWIFGNNIEDNLGRFKFIIFYFICGIAAAMAQILSAPASSIPMVGASGAIAGVMGAYLVLFPRARILTLVPILFFFTFFELPAIIIIGYWALLQFLSASFSGGGEMLRTGGVAYFAHIGGFVSGIILIFIFRRRPKSRHI